MSNPIYELAIVGRITWDLHSLNNEGSLGNVTEPRTVMLADGTKSDGVSGEMLKHVHVQSLWQIAGDKLPLCSNCRTLEPNKANEEERIGALGKEYAALDKKAGKGGRDGDGDSDDGTAEDSATAKKAQAKANADKARRKRELTEQAMKLAISQCAICDLHGFLVEKPTINRSSCLEFGWAVGLPDQWHRDLHLHARHAVGERSKPKGEKAEGEDSEGDDSGTSQMVYNRPTRSGKYAVVTLFAPWRIGLEHFDYTYVIGHADRKTRFDLAMRAYQAMFWRTDGAMTTTRLPHIEGFEGAVVVSRTNLPVPTVSALADDYIAQLKGLAATIGGGLEVLEFSDMAGFVRATSDLAATGEPFTLQKGG
jgi:CRISPR-associated protein Cst2